MDRRKFLLQSSAAAAVACSARCRAQDAPGVTVELMEREGQSANQVPLTYMGLSYELAQLTDPNFFSASNRDLVAYFRLLSRHGVLRLGGNTSEFCWFQADASTPEPKLHVPAGSLDANWMPHRQFAIIPAAIDALAGFLRATEWRLIYGLNFGNSTPERAASEAAYVMRQAGDRLEFFQIGNEPDLYHRASNGTRPPEWGFQDYGKEWVSFAEAIVAKAPGARFGGPDVAASSDWVTKFGDAIGEKLASRLVAMTGHYYAEGPPNDPLVTTERLLGGNPKLTGEMNAIEETARARSLIYRMTEGNTCYRGGKPGMSNAFASALWAGDYLLELASLGCAGVNLHGGTGAMLSAGLGDHTPGLEVAKTPQAMRAGFYTPIFAEPGSDIKAMPIFYGMLLANEFAGCTMMNANAEMQGVNATAYAAKHEAGFKVAIFNKDASKAIDVSVRAPRKSTAAAVWRLEAPALDSTEDVTLAGARILPHGEWNHRVAEPVEVRDGMARIRLRAASAALLFLA